jgi:hypothetical protein
MRASLTLITVVILVSVMLYPEAFGAEQKQTSTKPQQDSSKLQTDKITQTKPTHDTFVSKEGWVFSLTLPADWAKITNIPFAFADTKTDGNHILVDNVPIKQEFASRDDFHSYLKKTEMNSAGFSLGNSMTTMNTDYGYKTTIELKLTKQDGDKLLMRKDFHYVNQQGNMYLIHGFSSDSDSFKTLRYTMSTFKPLA